MAIPDYCVVGQLVHAEDVYLVTRKLTLPEDHVFILKYTGSSFLYPEPYYNVSLQNYLELRQPSDHVLKLILLWLQDISTKYHIQPKDMLNEGVTFDHKENRFMYPKQLIGFSQNGQGQTPFEMIKEYLERNQRDSKEIQEIIKKILENKGYKVEEDEELRELIGRQDNEKEKKNADIEEDAANNDIEVVQDGNRTPELHGSEDEEEKIVEQQKPEEKEVDQIENTSEPSQLENQILSPSEIQAQYLKKQFHLSNEERLAKIILSKRQTYESSVVFSFLESKKEIQIQSPDDKQLLDLFNYATLYKKIGQHKLAKTLYGYFQKVLEESIKKQQDMFEREEPKIVHVKLDLSTIIEWVKSLKKDVQEDEEGFLIIGIEQHSTEWFRQRKLRVTASNFGNLSKAMTIEKLNRAVMEQLFPKFFGNDATRYGTDTESEARDKYISLNNDQEYVVKEFGLIVDKQYPWIAGSPDGIVYQHGKRIGCLEIKCPYTMRDRSILENIDGISFLEKSNENGSVSLKHSHAYYSQCQGIMRLSGMSWCDFFVYSKIDSITVRVEYDEEFMKTLIESLNQYYFRHLLVELLQPCQSIHIEQQVLHEEIQEILEEHGYDFEEIQKERVRQEGGIQEQNQDQKDLGNNNNNNNNNNINNGGADDTEKEDDDNNNEEDSHGTQALEDEGDDNDDKDIEKNNDDDITNKNNNNNPTQELIESSQEMDLGLDDQEKQQQGLNEQQDQQAVSSNHNNTDNDIELSNNKPGLGDNDEKENVADLIEEHKEQHNNEDSAGTQPLDNESNDDTQPLDEE